MPRGHLDLSSGRAPAACPECGWTAGGELEVVDRYAEDWPPIPWCDIRDLRTSPDPDDYVSECAVCDLPLDPDNVVPPGATLDKDDSQVRGDKHNG